MHKFDAKPKCVHTFSSVSIIFYLPLHKNNHKPIGINLVKLLAIEYVIR